MSTEDELRIKAEKRAGEKIDFFRHLAAYIGVNLFFILIWAVSTGYTGGYPWFLWITGPWGGGLFIHFITAFYTTGAYREKAIEKEMEKLKR